MSKARNQRLRAKRKIQKLAAKLTPEQAEQLLKELESEQASQTQGTATTLPAETQGPSAQA